MQLNQISFKQRKSKLCDKKMFVEHKYLTLETTKKNFEIQTVRPNSFQKPQLQAILIFFNLPIPASVSDLPSLF